MRLRLFPPGRRQQQQHGFSLLEVLITLLILSLGLLGLAGLTGTSLRMSKASEFQGIALQLANDYADRMRGNPKAVVSGLYDLTDPYSASAAHQTVPSCTACTAEDIAAIDRAEWTNNVRDRLPAGGAWVTHRGSSVRVWIIWEEPGANTAPEPDIARCPAEALAGSPPSSPVTCFHYPAKI